MRVISSINLCIQRCLFLCGWNLFFILLSAGEPAEKDLPAGGAASQWDAAEGWAGAEMQVRNTSLLLFLEVSQFNSWTRHDTKFMIQGNRKNKSPLNLETVSWIDFNAQFVSRIEHHTPSLKKSWRNWMKRLNPRHFLSSCIIPVLNKKSWLWSQEMTFTLLSFTGKH